MATSKGRRGATSSGSNTSSSSGNDVSETSRRRSNKTDGVSTRRGNEPGQYQKRGDEPDFESSSDDDLMPVSGSGLSPRNMESAFDDDDMDADVVYDYELDEGDSGIDWDDSIPPRGGGKSPDK